LSKLQKTLEKLANAKKTRKNSELSRLYREACRDADVPLLIQLEAGLHFMREGQMAFAHDIFLDATRRDKDRSADPFKCMGMWALNSGKADQAIDWFQKVIEIQPTDWESHSNLALAYQSAGKLQEASNVYALIQKSTRLDERTLYNLSQLYMMEKRFAEAIPILSSLSGEKVDINALEINLIACQIEIGDTDAARSSLVKHFSKIFKCKYPDDPLEEKTDIEELIHGLSYFAAFPFIHRTDEDRQACLNSSIEILERLNQLSSSSELKKFESFWVYILLRISTFAVAYLQEEDVRLAELFHGLASKLISDTDWTCRQGKSNTKKSIVIISEYFGLHAVKWIVDLLRHTRDRYQISLIAVNGVLDEDWFTLQASDFAIDRRIVNEETYKKFIEEVRAQNFDLCIFPDVGMTASSRFLSNFRLARKQLVHWAHPVTTGSKHIDYFLSAEGMETKDAKTRYTETLLTLPGFGLWLPKRDWAISEREVETIQRERTKSGIRRIVTIQSLWKYLPATDKFWMNLLRGLPEDYKLSFILLGQEKTDGIFVSRIKAAFAEGFPEGWGRVEFSPRLDKTRYPAYLKESWLNIDSFGWSGGNTFLDACDVLLPTLTVPGGTLRANHTKAGLEQIEMPDLIFQDSEKLSRFVLELAQSSDLYNDLIQRLARGRDQLVNREAVLENFRDLLGGII
jgi:predicted O-linked N-acetylglucosamine transferase (SPINDLY family)